MFHFKCYLRYFPDDSMVKTLPSNVWDASSIPGQETKIPYATCKKKKKKGRSNIVTNSIKTLKIAHDNNKNSK